MTNSSTVKWSSSFRHVVFLSFLLNLSCNSYNFLVTVSIWLYSKFLSNKMFEQDHLIKGFPRNSVSKESVCNAGDPSSISGLGRSPGDGNGNPLWYSCLQNPMLREAWQATVHGVARVGHNLAMTPPPFNKKILTLYHSFPQRFLFLIINKKYIIIWVAFVWMISNNKITF